MKQALIILAAALTIGLAVYAAQRLAQRDGFTDAVAGAGEELRDARISGNEASAISSLRTLKTVSEQYRVRFGEYPGATSADGLGDLSSAALLPAPYIDTQLGGGQKSGFAFVYNGAVNTWDCTSTPVNNNVGVRSFFCDQSGVIRVSESGPATAMSPALD